METDYLLVYTNRFDDTFCNVQQLVDSVPLLRVVDEYVDAAEGCMIFRLRGSDPVIYLLKSMLDEAGIIGHCSMYQSYHW